jgi:hypothetical protein
MVVERLRRWGAVLRSRLVGARSSGDVTPDAAPEVAPEVVPPHGVPGEAAGSMSQVAAPAADVEDEGAAGPPSDGDNVDTLAGKLDTFPLDAVLRLIAGSGKAGVVKIESSHLTGRVFLDEGGITYATTRDVDGSPRQPRSTVATSTSSERRRRRFTDDPTLSGGDPVEEQIVEVMVRLLREAGGDFVFVPGVKPAATDAAAEQPFEVERILGKTKEHIEQWRRIEPLVPDTHLRFHMAEELPTETFEITLDAGKWLFLSAIGEGSSVNEVAERLGIFEFPAAMQVAELVRAGLLVPERRREAVAAEGEPRITVRTTFQPAPGTSPEPVADDPTPPPAPPPEPATPEGEATSVTTDAAGAPGAG